MAATPLKSTGKTSDRLAHRHEQILSTWEKRAMDQVDSATEVTNLALRDSLPLYLDHLSDALAKNRKMDIKSVEIHDVEAIRIGKLHGADRAGSAGYVLNEVIFEYHLLREVIFEVLEEEGQLCQLDRDIILDSIEQAVNDAAVKFSEVHMDIQRKFVATLTHDLKTPLTSTRMNAQIILKRSDRPEVCFKAATKIVSSVDRLADMIHDLLDAGMLRAGQQLKIQQNECDLDILIRDVVDDMNADQGERIGYTSSGSLEGVWGEDALIRALENLLGNALKYSRPGSPITVALRNLRESIEIEVHNVGNPISDKDQTVLFQQYRRTKSASESTVTGWGIGLMYVKGVADAHKGKVSVTSSEEEGTSFILSLPLAPHQK